MQAVVVHPGSVREAVAGPGARRALGRATIADVILPSAMLDPVARVGIYQGMYLLRMEEALASDYPAVQHLVGPRVFRRLVSGYVQRHPSRSYTLNRLGDHFPDFLARASVRRREAVADLARLELAVTEAFDAPETEALGEAEIASVPAEAWKRARLVPVAAFRLLRLGHAVCAYYESARTDGHRHPAIRRAARAVVVWRRRYAITRMELDGPAHDLLLALAKGRALGSAVGAVLRRGGRRAPSEHELFRWFRQWAAGGMFRAVRGPDGRVLAGRA